MSRKIVINACFGGFSLSVKAIEHYIALKELLLTPDEREMLFVRKGRGISRDDPHLIKTVEILGSEKASGDYAQLEIVKIPDNVGNNWFVADYDGLEHIAEKHRTWGRR